MIEIDPAKPEDHPSIFIRVRCAQCSQCIFDRRFNRCIYGGPFNQRLEYDPNATKRIEQQAAQ